MAGCAPQPTCARATNRRFAVRLASTMEQPLRALSSMRSTLSSDLLGVKQDVSAKSRLLSKRKPRVLLLLSLAVCCSPFGVPFAPISPLAGGHAAPRPARGLRGAGEGHARDPRQPGDCRLSREHVSASARAARSRKSARCAGADQQQPQRGVFFRRRRRRAPDAGRAGGGGGRGGQRCVGAGGRRPA